MSKEEKIICFRCGKETNKDFYGKIIVEKFVAVEGNSIKIGEITFTFCLYCFFKYKDDMHDLFYK